MTDFSNCELLRWKQVFIDNGLFVSCTHKNQYNWTIIKIWGL